MKIDKNLIKIGQRWKVTHYSETTVVEICSKEQYGCIFVKYIGKVTGNCYFSFDSYEWKYILLPNQDKINDGI